MEFVVLVYFFPAMADRINRQLRPIASTDFRTLSDDRLLGICRKMLPLIQRCLALWRISFESGQVDYRLFGESFRLCFKCSCACISDTFNRCDQGISDELQVVEDSLATTLWKLSDLEFLKAADGRESILWPNEMALQLRDVVQNNGLTSIIGHFSGSDRSPLKLFILAYIVEVVGDVDFACNIAIIIRCCLKCIDSIEQRWKNTKDIQLLKNSNIRFVHAVSRSLAARKRVSVSRTDSDLYVRKSTVLFHNILVDLKCMSNLNDIALNFFLITVANTLAYAMKLESDPFDGETIAAIRKCLDCIIFMFINNLQLRELLYSALKKCIILFPVVKYTEKCAIELLGIVDVRKIGKRYTWRLCGFCMEFITVELVDNDPLVFDHLMKAVNNFGIGSLEPEDFPHWRRFVGFLCEKFPERLISNSNFKQKFIENVFQDDWDSGGDRGRLALLIVEILSKNSNWRLYLETKLKLAGKLESSLQNMTGSLTIDIDSYISMIEIAFNFRHQPSLIRDIHNFPKLVRNNTLLLLGQSLEKGKIVKLSLAINLLLQQFMDFQDFLSAVIGDPLFISLISILCILSSCDGIIEQESQFCVGKLYRMLSMNPDMECHPDLIFFSLKPFVRFARSHRKRWSYLSFAVDLIKEKTKPLIGRKYQSVSNCASLCIIHEIKLENDVKMSVQTAELTGLIDSSKFSGHNFEYCKHSRGSDTASKIEGDVYIDRSDAIQIKVTDHDKNGTLIFHVSKRKLMTRSDFWSTMFKRDYAEKLSNEVCMFGSHAMFQVYFDYVEGKNLPVLLKTNLFVMILLFDFAESILELELCTLCVNWLHDALLDASVASDINDLIVMSNVLETKEEGAIIGIKDLKDILNILFHLYGCIAKPA